VVKLSEAEKERVIGLIQEGKSLPLKCRSALFAGDDTEYVEATKDYRLVYKGKMPKEAILRTTLSLTRSGVFWSHYSARLPCGISVCSSTTSAVRFHFMLSFLN